MQTIYIDISNKGVIPTIYAKQGDVGRKFEIVFTDSGLPYTPPNASVFSVWYSGTSGEGNYTDIGDRSAFSINANKVSVEMIAQMLENFGDGVLCLVLNESNGNQIGSWNIPYMCEQVPGIDSEEAKSYYTAFSEAVANLPYPDNTLSVAGKAADAAATGAALAGKASLLQVYPVGAIYISTVSTSPASLFGGTWEQLKDRFLLGAGGSYSNGATGGEATHTLTVDEMPSHGHQLSRVANAKVTTGGANILPAGEDWAQGTTTTSAAGGGQPHNNMPPYLAVYIWKRVA